MLERSTPQAAIFPCRLIGATAVNWQTWVAPRSGSFNTATSPVCQRSPKNARTAATLAATLAETSASVMPSTRPSMPTTAALAARFSVKGSDARKDSMTDFIGALVDVDLENLVLVELAAVARLQHDRRVYRLDHRRTMQLVSRLELRRIVDRCIDPAKARAGIRAETDLAMRLDRAVPVRASRHGKHRDFPSALADHVLAHGKNFQRFFGHGERIALAMQVVEASGSLLQRRLGLAIALHRHRRGELVHLPYIAHLCVALDAHLLDTGQRLDRPRRIARQPAERPGELLGIDRRQPSGHRGKLRNPQVCVQPAARAEHRSGARHQHLADTEVARLGGRGDAAGAAERHQGEIARVVTLRHRYIADAVGHVVVDDAQHAERRFVDAHAEGLGHVAADRFGGERLVQAAGGAEEANPDGTGHI